MSSPQLMSKADDDDDGLDDGDVDGVDDGDDDNMYYSTTKVKRVYNLCLFESKI